MTQATTNKVLKVNHIYTQVLKRSYIKRIRQLLLVRHPNYEKIIKNDRRRRIYRYTDPDGTVRWDGYISFLKHDKNRGYYFMSGLVGRVLDGWYQQWGPLKEENIIRPEYPDISMSIPNLGDYELRDYQERAYINALEAKRGILHLATNAGKTLIATALTKHLNVPTLFVVHRKTLLHQAYDSFAEHISEEEIGKIGDDFFEPNKFTISTIQTLANSFKKKGSKYIPLNEIAEWLQETEMVFFDECHTTGIGQGLTTVGFNCPAMYRFGLSGTPTYKDDLDTTNLISVTDDVIATTRNKELIEKGYSSDPVVCMIDTEDVEIPESANYSRAYDIGIKENEQRNEKVLEIVKMAKKLGLPTVILVKRIQHGKDFVKMAKQYNIKAEFIWGETSTTKRQNVMNALGNELDAIFATNILEEGVNIPQMRVLILAGGGKSKRSSLQSIGRVLRRYDESKEQEDVYIFDFYDGGSKYLVDHTINRVEHYRDEKFKIIDGFPEEFEEILDYQNRLSDNFPHIRGDRP